MSEILNSILSPILTGLVVGCVMLFVLSKSMVSVSEETDEPFYNSYYPEGAEKMNEYTNKFYFMVTFIIKGRMKKPFHFYHELETCLTLDEAMKYIEMHYSSMLSIKDEAWDYKIISKKTKITAEQAKELDELLAELEKQREEEERAKYQPQRKKRTNRSSKKKNTTKSQAKTSSTSVEPSNINKEEGKTDE